MEYIQRKCQCSTSMYHTELITIEGKNASVENICIACQSKWAKEE